jgi:hypothetical protein
MALEIGVSRSMDYGCSLEANDPFAAGCSHVSVAVDVGDKGMDGRHGSNVLAALTM